jgi:hypothetical protein
METTMSIAGKLGIGMVTAWAVTSMGCHSGTSNGGWVLEDLPPTKGMSFRLPPFVVQPGTEEQTCYFVRAPDLNHGQDFWVDHIRAAATPGTHHLNVFRVRTIVGLDPAAGSPIKLGDYSGTVIYGHGDYMHSPCWASANWADWPLVSNTQSPKADNPYTDWQMPEHVALRFTPGELLMIQSHYVNSTLQPSPEGANVGINMYRSSDPAPIEVGTLFATQQNIRICESRPDVTYSGACHLPGSSTIIGANGHFHSRGKEFTIYAWDGISAAHPPASEMFYDSTQWDAPLMATSLDVSIGGGGGVWWDCAYEWRQPISGCGPVNQKDKLQQNDCCYTFGGATDVGEHCNVFVYYYPKAADSDVFCN